MVTYKLRTAFNSSRSCFRFFDVSGAGGVIREHFLVCLGTLEVDMTFSECMALFDSVDAAHVDDVLDEAEFSAGLYGDMSGLTG